MSAGLFDNTDGGVPPAATEQVAGRRAKLFPWDSVATQLFEPHGESALDAMSLKQIWEAAMKGNKKAAYRSHLCADKTTDAWRVGAGISLTAASLLSATKHFRNPDIKKIIVPELYAKVENELQALEPKLQLLNPGKGSQSQKDTGSFQAAKRLKATGAGTEGALATEGRGGGQILLQVARPAQERLSIHAISPGWLQHILLCPLRGRGGPRWPPLQTNVRGRLRCRNDSSAPACP